MLSGSVWKHGKRQHRNKTYKQTMLNAMTLLKIFAIPSAKQRSMHRTPVLFAEKLVSNSAVPRVLKVRGPPRRLINQYGCIRSQLKTTNAFRDGSSNAQTGILMKVEESFLWGSGTNHCP